MEPEKIENRIAILIFLPEEISSVIKSVKEETKISYPNHETQTPHVTIYSCKFDESKLQELIQGIKNLDLKPFSVKMGDLMLAKLNKGSNNLFASMGFEDETPLRELHEKIWPVANELRGDLIRGKDIERFKNGIYSQELFSFIEKYGYEHVRENFHPHVTLGEVFGEDSQKTDFLKDALRTVVGREFLVSKIYILLSTRMVMNEKKIKESEVFEIAFGS